MGFFKKKNLAELKRENEQAKAVRDYESERSKLKAETKQYKAETRDKKYGGFLSAAKKTGSGLGSVGKTFGSGLLKISDELAKRQPTTRKRKKTTKRKTKRKTHKKKRVVMYI